MKTRAEAVKLLTNQLDDVNACGREKGQQVHYGKQELRELLDFIYESEPRTDEEKLK